MHVLVISIWVKGTLNFPRGWGVMVVGPDLCLPKLWKFPEEPHVKHPLGIKRVFEVGIVAPNFTNLVKLTPHLNTLSDP